MIDLNLLQKKFNKRIRKKPKIHQTIYIPPRGDQENDWHHYGIKRSIKRVGKMAGQT